MNTKKKTTWITLSYVIVLASYFLENTGHILNTSLAAPFAKSLGITGAVLNLIPGLMSLAAMFFRPVSGWIADRFNRKKTNLIVLLLFVLIFVGYAFTENGTMLLIMRVLNGFTFCAFTTVSVSMIADSVEEEKLVVASTYYGLVATITAAAAPTLGVFLRDRIGYRGMYLFFAALFLVGTGILAFLTGKTENETQERKGYQFSVGSLISVASIPLSLIGMLSGMADGAIQSLLLVSAESQGIENASLFFTFSAIVSVCTRPLVSLILKKIKPIVLLVPTLVFICLALLVLSFADRTGTLIFAGIINGMGYGTALGLLQGLVLLQVDASKRGVASGTLYFGLDIGHFLGPTLMGAVVTAAGGNYSIGWLTTIIYVAVSILITFLIMAKEKKQAAK